MANGETLAQLRDMANSGKLTSEQALPILMAGVADLLENQNEIKKDYKAHNEKIANAVKDIASNKEDIQELKKRSNLWDGINSFLALLGGAIAAWLSGK